MESRPDSEREPPIKKAPGPLPKPTRPKVIFSETKSEADVARPVLPTNPPAAHSRSTDSRSTESGSTESGSTVDKSNTASQIPAVGKSPTEQRRLKPVVSELNQRSRVKAPVAPASVRAPRPERDPSVRAPSVERHRPSTDSNGLNGLYFLLASAALMFGMWFIGPRLVEEYHYAAERGKSRATYENAVTQLEQQPLANVSYAYQLVAQKIRPSVVSVNAIKRRSQTLSDGNGLGSGVIMSADGYILTNAHVLEGASRYLIELADRRRFEASLVGTDSTSDLALLKISAPDLIPATWGDSDQVDVGSIVWAIGSPYGFQQTITSGIISGKDRPGDPMHQKQSLLQTDAAVNPGNSGGPLVDAQGQVIGINTSIFGETFQGISFAVPSQTAKFVYQELLSNGKVTRGYLGAKPDEVHFNDAVRMQLPDLDGAKLSQIQRHSPAYYAGIRSGDIIRSWGGVEIKEFKDLYRLAEKAVPDSRVLVTLLRNGQEHSTEVVVGTLPDFASIGRIDSKEKVSRTNQTR